MNDERVACPECGRKIKESSAVFVWFNGVCKWFGCKRCNQDRRREVSGGMKKQP